MFLLIPFTVITMSPLQFTFGCGLLAAILSHICKQGRWWLPIQLLFAPAVIGALALNLSPLYYLTAFLILLMVYWSTFHSQVPLYLSSNKVWSAMEAMLPPDRSYRFMDVGSGLGGLLLHLAKTRSQGKHFGIESAPLPFLVSWLRIRMSRSAHCEVKWGNYWDIDFGQYDIVFAYLSPVPMFDLWQKARSEMSPGSKFISNTFAVPNIHPDHMISVDDLHQSILYIWEM